MSPLDRLPENAFKVELSRRAAESQQLKGSFQAFGSTSVKTHRIFSPNIYDIQFNASPIPGTVVVHQVDVEFIPDDMTFGGAFCYQVLARYLDLSNNPATWYFRIAERKPSINGRQQWSFYHLSFGYATDSVRLKFYFFATGSGTFTTNVII